MPVPEPTPVATKTTPTVFEAAPIAVKSVVPIDAITYVTPITNPPALALEVIVYVLLLVTV